MRDYARNSHPTKKKSESDGTGILVFLVICTLLFAGYATYHYTHENVIVKNAVSTVQSDVLLPTKLIKKINNHKVAPHKIIAHKKPKKIVKKSAKKATPINPADIQPKYDFYKLLPTMTVLIPKEDESLSPQSPLP